jgi:hypothetical protein
MKKFFQVLFIGLAIASIAQAITNQSSSESSVERGKGDKGDTHEPGV